MIESALGISMDLLKEMLSRLEDTFKEEAKYQPCAPDDPPQFFRGGLSGDLHYSGGAFSGGVS